MIEPNSKVLWVKEDVSTLATVIKCYTKSADIRADDKIHRYVPIAQLRSADLDVDGWKDLTEVQAEADVAIADQLSLVEQETFTQLEQTIKNGIVAFASMGRAFREIRDRRLYRKIYGTFEDYCQFEFNLTPRRVNQLIAAVQVLDNLGTTGSQNLEHLTERAIRPLVPLMFDVQLLVWRKLTVNGQVPSSKDIRQKVQEVLILQELIGRGKISSNLDEII